jgi:coatomer subunit gamma
MINFIYLLNQGEKFTNQEKEFLFFSISKLFPSNDLELRRIVFLFLKQLNYYENSFMLNGALVNEINKNDSFLKGSSFRLLGRIVDVSGVAPIERLLKNAISSNLADVSSSAIICTLYMSIRGFNIARPWISEITDKLNTSISQSNLVTFHTLLLLREIKDNDKLYLLKTYLNLSQSGMRSQFATCQLIRYIVEFINRGQVDDAKTLSALMSYLESCMFKTQQEAVSIEAARGILELENVKTSLLTSTFETLKSHLNNGKRVVKYSALKTLDRAANKHAKQLSLDIFLDLEKIIDDNANNASIKAIALSIFLKISKGLSDFRLEKMFKTFTDQYTTFKEEFKKEIVMISQEISREDPGKNKLYFNFFASLLKLEASLPTKIEILDAIIWYIYNDQALKKVALLSLAEYIEDCQFDNIKTRILSVLGKEGISANSPSQLVRYIYNRIILENAVVRAAAVSALGDIAYKNENLRKNILNLIKNSLHDIDNEVRERAYFYVKALTDSNELDTKENSAQNSAIKAYVFGEKKYDIDLIQNLLKIQKDQLLNSDNIAKELTSTLNDPEKIKKVMSNLQVIKENQAKVSHSGKPVSKMETKEEQIYPGCEEFKKTVFYKVHGHPKRVSKSVVKNF